jgi:hypothetical protein
MVTLSIALFLSNPTVLPSSAENLQFFKQEKPQLSAHGLRIGMPIIEALNTFGADRAVIVCWFSLIWKLSLVELATRETFC